MQGEQERICRFCKKLLNLLEGKRVPVVSVFNRLKKKELPGASGQESVVLAAEVEKLGHCLHHGMNFPELPCLSCARQVVRVVYSPDQCTTPTSSSRRPTAVRSPTGETPSAKRNKEGNAIDEESETGKSSWRSLSLSLSVDMAAIEK